MYSSATAYLLWLPGLCGLCGLHRFYLGRPVSGIIWLLTFGLFFIGQIIDLFLIPTMCMEGNLLLGGTRNVNTNIVNVEVGDRRSRKRRYDEDEDDDDYDRPRRRRRSRRDDD